MPKQKSSANKLNDPGWDEVFEHAGQMYDIDPLLLKGMMYTESGADTSPENRLSAFSGSAYGPMQFIPSTAQKYAVDPFDPWDAIHGAAKYMSDNLKTYNGDVRKALLQYNGGNDPKKWNQAYADSVARYYNQMLQPQRNSRPRRQPFHRVPLRKR